GADGRGDIGGGGERWADAADAGAHFVGAAGGGAVHRGVHEQGGHGGRSGVVGFGGAGSAGVVVEVPVSWGRHSDHTGFGAEGAERAELGSWGREVHIRVDERGGHVRADAEARHREGVFDAGGRCVFDIGSWDGGDGTSGERDDQDGGGSGASGDQGDSQVRG